MIARAWAWLRSLWWNLVQRDRVEDALDDEIRTYVELLAEDYERQGLSRAEARRAALVATRGVDQVKEATRDSWAGNSFATMQRELRYAVRTLRRAPAFVAISVVTLALGIGGSTAVFTVINGSLLRPLPGVAHPEELVTIERMQKTRMIDEISQPDYEDLRARSTTLAGIAGYNGTSMALGQPESPRRVWVSYVTDNFFSALGVRPHIGRVFAEPRVSDEGDVVVIGYDLWRTDFAASPSVVGSTIRLDGRPFTVIGVAPPKFIGAMALHDMEMWIPVTSPAIAFNLTSRRSAWMRAVGRLAPNKTLADVQRDLDATASILASTYPESNANRSFKVVPGSGMTPEERVAVARVPRILAIAVSLLLLIACGNVAALSLVRAAARRRELATRLALGASRGALVRQVVLEGTLIATAAGAIGVALAALFVRSATLVHTVVDIDVIDATIDLRVLALAIGAATLTAILVSLLPALQAARVPAAAVLKDGGAIVRGRSGQRLLVMTQIAASLVLLYGTGLIFTAFQRVLASHDAVDPRTIVTAGWSTSKLDSTARTAYYRTLLARLANAPELDGIALANTVPPFQWSGTAAVFRHGEEPPPGAVTATSLEGAPRANTIVVSPSFFEVMRIPLLIGRRLTPADDERAEHVVVINRALADALWSDGDPIGRVIAWPSVEGPPRAPLRVVGVVANTRAVSGDSKEPPAMYFPFPQQPSWGLTIIARSRGSVEATQALLRRVPGELDTRVIARSITTLATRLGEEVRPQRAASAWVGVFGVIAVVLAAIGLYGVVMQTVLQRTRELALRFALGATPRGVLGSVMRDGMSLTLGGAVLGGLASVAAYRIVGTLFARVEAVDPRPASAALAVLVIVTAIATYIPARRAARLNPADVLRSD